MVGEMERTLVFACVLGCVLGERSIWTILKQAKTYDVAVLKVFNNSMPYAEVKPQYPMQSLPIPDTNFTCLGKIPGFYADVTTGCQVFYRCDNSGNRIPFLCTNRTIFNQITLVCDYWFNVECHKSPEYATFANARLNSNLPLFDSPDPSDTEAFIPARTVYPDYPPKRGPTQPTQAWETPAPNPTSPRPAPSPATTYPTRFPRSTLATAGPGNKIGIPTTPQATLSTEELSPEPTTEPSSPSPATAPPARVQTTASTSAPRVTTSSTAARLTTTSSTSTSSSQPQSDPTCGAPPPPTPQGILIAYCAGSSCRGSLLYKNVEKFLNDLPEAPADDAMIADPSLFEGDMASLPVGSDPAKKQILTPGEVSAEAYRWPNKIIPYAFYEKIDAKSMQVTTDAMDDLELKTCVRFVPRTYQEDFLKISPGKACASDVGYKKGEHLLSVNPGCMDDLGALQHEILHALGIVHEQSRPDRDQHVFVDFDNIMPDSTSQAQFYIFKSAQVVDLGVPYDYASIMHYPAMAFARNPSKPTIVPYEQGHILGNRVELSPLDIKRINRLYRCDDNPNDEKPLTITREVVDDFKKTFHDYEKLCDGNRDTQSGLDEDPNMCLKQCHLLDTREQGLDGNNLYSRATTKQCLHKKHICNYTREPAYDNTDGRTLCRKYCRLGGYVSMPETAQCVHFKHLCDGVKDTSYGEDENPNNCQFLCKSEDSGFYGQLFNSEEEGMRCYKKNWLCDGKHMGSFANQTYCKKYCTGSGFFPIGPEQQCIHVTKLCDGKIDTLSGLDEQPSTCQSACAVAIHRVADYFMVPATSQCGEKRWLCDGTQHDKENLMGDPKFCKEKCPGGAWLNAPNGQCFAIPDLCDGKYNVRNGYDENPENCKRLCKPTADFPPPGRYLRVDNKTSQCIVVRGVAPVSVDTASISGVSSGVDSEARADNSGDLTLQGSVNPADSVSFIDSSSGATGTRSPDLPFIFGKANATTLDNGWKQMVFPNNTHQLMSCGKGLVITIEFADYVIGDERPHCADFNHKMVVARKCDQLPACGYIANDPSNQSNCKDRDLVVKYSCAARADAFVTDRSADDLCNTASKNASSTVQCNLSAEALMP